MNRNGRNPAQDVTIIDPFVDEYNAGLAFSDDAKRTESLTIKRSAFGFQHVESELHILRAQGTPIMPPGIWMKEKGDTGEIVRDLETACQHTVIGRPFVRAGDN